MHPLESATTKIIILPAKAQKHYILISAKKCTPLDKKCTPPVHFGIIYTFFIEK
jgi:hypothetical protein